MIANNVKRGKACEYSFVSEAIKKGLTVCLPTDEANDFDFVTIKNKKINKVQLRSVYKMKKSFCKRDNLQSERFCFNLPKDKKDIDVLVLHIEPTNKWYIIPYKDITVGTIAFNPSAKAKGSQYDKYENNWEVLL